MMMLFNLTACGTKDAGANKVAGYVAEEGINDFGKGSARATGQMGEEDGKSEQQDDWRL